MIEHTIFSDRKELNLMLFYQVQENKYIHKERKERVFVKKSMILQTILRLRYPLRIPK